MVRKLLAACCLGSMCFMSVTIAAQTAPQVVVYDTIHTAIATQTIASTNDSYTIKMLARPFADGDHGVGFNTKGNAVAITMFKLDFSTKVNNPSSTGNLAPTSLEKVITVSYNGKSQQLQVDNPADLHQLQRFVAGSSIDADVSSLLNALDEYFPVKCNVEGIAPAISEFADFAQKLAAGGPAPMGTPRPENVGVVVIFGVICLFECADVAGCAIGAGGFNSYFLECMDPTN